MFCLLCYRLSKFLLQAIDYDFLLHHVDVGLYLPCCLTGAHCFLCDVAEVLTHQLAIEFLQSCLTVRLRTGVGLDCRNEAHDGCLLFCCLLVGIGHGIIVVTLSLLSGARLFRQGDDCSCEAYDNSYHGSDRVGQQHLVP